jgi:hypothetical protein
MIEHLPSMHETQGLILRRKKELWRKRTSIIRLKRHFQGDET